MQDGIMAFFGRKGNGEGKLNSERGVQNYGMSWVRSGIPFVS